MADTCRMLRGHARTPCTRPAVYQATLAVQGQTKTTQLCVECAATARRAAPAFPDAGFGLLPASLVSLTATYAQEADDA